MRCWRRSSVVQGPTCLRVEPRADGVRVPIMDMFADDPHSAFFRQSRGSRGVSPLEPPWLDVDQAVLIATTRHPGDDGALMPPSAHIRSRLYTPLQFPYFSGRCTHCDPVWNLKAIASITSRWSRTSRWSHHRPPRLGVLSGGNGSIRAHRPSVNGTTRTNDQLIQTRGPRSLPKRGTASGGCGSTAPICSGMSALLGSRSLRRKPPRGRSRRCCRSRAPRPKGEIRAERSHPRMSSVLARSLTHSTARHGTARHGTAHTL
ncbi:hypothetical protein GA0115234_1081133 [Streptomyces sp. DvalAA-43]|nr:hypothetical protein GA0115234_1081133 [Streptomyces sp. DvalAA-43]